MLSLLLQIVVCSSVNCLHLLQVSLENGLFPHRGAVSLKNRNVFVSGNFTLPLKERIEVFNSFSSLCEVEGKVVMFVVVCMARNSSNSTFPGFPRTDAQVPLCVSVARVSLGHGMKEVHGVFYVKLNVTGSQEI